MRKTRQHALRLLEDFDSSPKSILGGNGKEQPKPVQYGVVGKNTFLPMGYIEFIDSLPPGAYSLNPTDRGIQFVHIKSKTDELYRFPCSAMDQVRKESAKFWTLKSKFQDLKLLHHRGILCYGDPGTGKSALIQQISEDMEKEGDIVIFSRELGLLMGALKSLRAIEPERRVAVVLEDLDEYAQYHERDLLQLLDGENTYDNILYIGTTNYISKLSPRLLRPGRFDKKVEVGFPPLEGRKIYLQKKLGHLARGEDLDTIARKTENFSFGHLRELIVAVYAFGDGVDDSIRRLKDLEYQSLPENSLEFLNDRTRKLSEAVRG